MHAWLLWIILIVNKNQLANRRERRDWARQSDAVNDEKKKNGDRIVGGDDS